MKKIIPSVLAVCLMLTSAAACFVGCSSRTDNDKISIVATIFPEYDWASEILGEHVKDVDLKLLLDSGVDLHNYQPTAEDIITIGTCDMFIYVGGYSDSWVEEVLEQAVNKDMVVINLMEVLGESVKEEEIVDGMEHEHDGAHVHGDDEHVWLSLNNAKVICSEIAEKLCVLDAENAADYTANMEGYCAELTVLSEKYQKAVDDAPVKTLLFGDRFPFRYLVDDYGIEYYAAFSGCSAESKASFETIAFLAGKTDELALSSVIKLEGSDGSIAQAIINASTAENAKILTLDSMQTVGRAQISEGVTYLSVMESNLEVLKEALK